MEIENNTEDSFLAAVEGEIKVAETVVEKPVDKTAEVVAETTKEEVAVEADKPAFDPLAVDNNWRNAEEQEAAQVEAPKEVETFLADRFGNYGIKTPDDIVSLIDTVESLKEQLASKPTTPVFENDAQAKLFEFAKQYDGTNGSVIAEFEHLQSLDVASLKAKDKLFEVYVQENRDMNRDDAKLLFEHEYDTKYGVEWLDPDIPEDEKAIRLRKILLERDSNNAGKKLVEVISKFKPVASQKEVAQVNPIIERAVSEYSARAEEELKSLNAIEVVLSLKKDSTGKIVPEDTYNLGLDKDQIDYISSLTKAHFSNKLNFTADGKEINGFSPKALAVVLAKSIYHDDIVRASVKRAVQLHEMRQIENKQPKGQKASVLATQTRPVVHANSEDAFLAAANV
jgi:hypothetical protein